MARKLLPSLLLLALLTTATAASAATFASRFLSFDDINGDGVLSCGDVVNIGIFYQTDPPDPTELHGFASMPETDSQGLSFLPGSVTTNFAFTTGCFATVLEGNSSGDSHARVEISCSQDPVVLPGGATMALSYKAIYTSPTFPQFTDTATFQFDLRPPGPIDHLHSTETRSTASACSAPPPTVTIEKSSLGPAIPGASHVYALTINNLSSLPLGGFYARESVPANTTFDPTNSSPGWFCASSGAPGAACSYLFSALNPGQTTITFSVTVDASIPPGVTNLSNTACVAESRTVYDCSSISDPFAGSPTLTITKSITGGTPAPPGGNVSFDLAIANPSPYGAADVLVTDTLPAGTTYNPTGSSSSWSCSSTACAAHLGSLSADQTKHLSIVLTVPNPLPAGGSNFTNTACATPLDGSTPVCSTAVFGANGTPILNLKKTLAQGNGTPGTDLVYNLSIRNDGNQDASSVFVAESYPAHTTPNLAASDPGWTCSGSTCSFPLGALAAGAQRNLRFVVTIANPLPVGVSSFVNTACPEAPGAVTACDSISSQPNGKVLLSVIKTIVTPSKTKPKVLAGDLLTYLVSVSNTGNQDAAAVTLQEMIPSFTTFVPAASDPWVCPTGNAGETCTISIGPLAAGASTSRRFALRVGDPPPHTNIRNTACATDSSGASGCGEIITDPDSPTILSAQLTATMATDNDSSGDLTPGDGLQYTARITNTGSARAGNAVFSILAPDHTTLIAGSVVTSNGAVTTGNALGDSTISVALGTLDPSASATITYQVTIDPQLPLSITSIISQGGASSSTAASILTDDPTTPAPADPTIVPVQHPQQQQPPSEIPTLGGVGLAILIALLALCATLVLRRRKTA